MHREHFVLPTRRSHTTREGVPARQTSVSEPRAGSAAARFHPPPSLPKKHSTPGAGSSAAVDAHGRQVRALLFFCHFCYCYFLIGWLESRARLQHSVLWRISFSSKRRCPRTSEQPSLVRGRLVDEGAARLWCFRCCMRGGRKFAAVRDGHLIRFIAG